LKKWEAKKEMRNWKRLLTLMSIVLIAFFLLSPILLVSAQPPPGPPYRTPDSIYYAVGIVGLITIVAGVYFAMKK
jgi:polyferredoxin